MPRERHWVYEKGHSKAIFVKEHKNSMQSRSEESGLSLKYNV